MDTVYYLTTKSSFVFNSSSYIKLLSASQCIWHVMLMMVSQDLIMDSVINTGICCDTNDQGFRRRRFATGT